MIDPKDVWFRAPKGRVWEKQHEQVRDIEMRQSATFERFLRLEVLYDPNSVHARHDSISVIDENVVATNVDTVGAVISTVEVRARFQTEDADWETQMRAKDLELYVEELVKLTGARPKVERGFKGATKKGTGPIFVSKAGPGKIKLEHVPVDDVIVDDAEMAGDDVDDVMTLHRIHRSVDMDKLIAEFPKHRDAIEKAARGGSSIGGYRPAMPGELRMIESWRRPVGEPGTKAYKPGRHVKTIEGTDLLDEEWHKDFFPVARMAWEERERSWYGISLAERIAGHQRSLNRRNWQIQRMLDQNAARITYVRPGDAGMLPNVTNPLGTLAVCYGEYPKTETPPMVNADILNSRNDLKVSASEESGVNRMIQHGSKPAGIDSGAAIREYRDATTQRFASQEKAFERLFLDVVVLMLDLCKDMGKDAPTMSRQTRFGARRLKWSDVDMKDVRVQIAAASTLPRTPAGRAQTVLEWAQAGVITMDEARRLMKHPDVDRALSVYTAAMESIEEALGEIERGRFAMPEPADNHQMCVRLATARYLIDRTRGAPESVLEGLRQYFVQAAWLVDQATAPTPTANENAAMAGAIPGAPGALPIDPALAAAPANAPAVAAFAPQAMDVLAG